MLAIGSRKYWVLCITVILNIYQGRLVLGCTSNTMTESSLYVSIQIKLEATLSRCQIQQVFNLGWELPIISRHHGAKLSMWLFIVFFLRQAAAVMRGGMATPFCRSLAVSLVLATLSAAEPMTCVAWSECGPRGQCGNMAISGRCMCMRNLIFTNYPKCYEPSSWVSAI